MNEAATTAPTPQAGPASTDPEIAHVCLYEREAEGFVKVLVKKGTDRILGAITRTIHPYPTQAEAIKRMQAETTGRPTAPKI